jgi:hypothetical protein
MIWIFRHLSYATRGAFRTNIIVSGYRLHSWAGPELTAQRTRSSKRPLSRGELIEFLLAAWSLKDALEMNELEREARQMNRYTLRLLK